MRKGGIMIVLLIGLFICGCNKNTYSACITQSIDNVDSIELLIASDTDMELLYLLTDNEIEGFWAQLMAIDFYKYFNDPPTTLGMYAVRITYVNGQVDTIGTDINISHSPEGESMRTGWYYAADSNDFAALFMQYADINVVPIDP